MTKPDPDLYALYEDLIANGCIHFYIQGIDFGYFGDVEALVFEDNIWQVYYTERGVKGKTLFSSDSKKDAIEFYRNHILSIRHSHLIVFTRSIDTLNHFKSLLKQEGIETWQNDMPAYKNRGDHVFRLFVFNKDIFKAKALIGVLPHKDRDMD